MIKDNRLSKPKKILGFEKIKKLKKGKKTRERKRKRFGGSLEAE